MFAMISPVDALSFAARPALFASKIGSLKILVDELKTLAPKAGEAIRIAPLPASYSGFGSMIEPVGTLGLTASGSSLSRGIPKNEAAVVSGSAFKIFG